MADSATPKNARTADLTEQHLRQIAAHVPGMMYRIHYTGDSAHYSFVSEGVRLIYGVRPEEVLADPLLLRRYRHPDDVARVDAAVALAVESDAPIDIEYRIRTVEGQVKWVQMSSSAVLRDEIEGAHEHWRVGVLLDVTARHQAQQALHERDAAEAAQRAMTAFLSRVSHELRTPLNAILGFAQLLHTDPGTSAHQQRWVHELLGAGKHLLALVEDVLDLSGAQSGEMRFETARLDLLALARECLPLVAQAASERGVHVQVAQGTLPALGDARRCKQILINLLTNAVKYNQPGGEVQLLPWPEAAAATADAGQVALAVCDTGVGLSEAQQARLFQPFERAGAQHGAASGTGLGLALSRRLAQGMGGEIELSSQPGRGSRFVLRLRKA